MKLRYQEAVLKALFHTAKAFLQSCARLTDWHTSCKFKAAETVINIHCQTSLNVWIGYLEGLSSFSELEKQLDMSKDDERTSLTPKSRHCLQFCDRCPLLEVIARLCTHGLQRAKSIKFAAFLGT